MDLRDFRLTLRRNWLFAILAFDVCIILGIAAAFLPQSTYRASTSLSAQPQVTSGASDLTRLTQFVIPIVVTTAESRSVRDTIRETLPEEIQPFGISVSVSANASVLRIQVESNSPQSAKFWADAIAETVIDMDISPLMRLALIDAAVVPTTPVAPRPVPIMLAAGVLGLIAAVFAAVFAGRVRDAFDSAELIRQRLGTNVIGELPRMRMLRRSDRALIDILDEGSPLLAESFKSLRTNLEFRLAAQKPRAVAISSYQMGEGKSSVCAGIGWALAAVGQEVIAIDSDLRRPALHHRLGRPMDLGLADLRLVDFDDVLQSTNSRGLRFVPAGLPDRSPADVVAVNLPRAIEEARARANVVLVDAPPLEMVAETPQVISNCGHVILVVDAGSVNLPELANAVAQLREQGAELLGVVINRVRRRWWSRTYDYYSYGTQTTERKPARQRAIGGRTRSRV